jgi:hypothetical protein
MPFVFSWADFLRCVEMVWTVYVTLSTVRVTWALLMAWLVSSFTFLALVELVWLRPNGVELPTVVHVSGAFTKLGVYVWQVRFFFLSKSQVTLPVRLMLIHKGTCACMTVILILTFGLSLLRYFNVTVLADRLESIFFRPSSQPVEERFD